MIVDLPKPNYMSYVWAALALFLLAGLFILAILVLRPNLDPLLLISAVAAVVGTMFTSVSAFLKSQETHLIVNSELEKWKKDFAALSHAQGIIDGTKAEQARVSSERLS